MKKLVDGAREAKLCRGGRPKGARSLVSKTFHELAKSTLEDPEIQAKLRQRLLELAGRVRDPLPCLAVMAAASVREKPDLRSSRPVVFVAEIVAGRGYVTRVELARDAEELPALPTAPAAGGAA